jgi:hypothetical protein
MLLLQMEDLQNKHDSGAEAMLALAKLSHELRIKVSLSFSESLCCTKSQHTGDFCQHSAALSCTIDSFTLSSPPQRSNLDLTCNSARPFHSPSASNGTNHTGGLSLLGSVQN